MKSLDSLKPKTLEGVKRLAKQIGKERGIGHAQALEAAAQQAGFANYQACRQALEAAAGGGR